MRYRSKLLAGYERFYRRLLYHKAIDDVIIYYDGDLFGMRVVQDEVHQRTELGLKLIKRIKELGLR